MLHLICSCLKKMTYFVQSHTKQQNTDKRMKSNPKMLHKVKVQHTHKSVVLDNFQNFNFSIYSLLRTRFENKIQNLHFSQKSGQTTLIPKQILNQFFYIKTGQK